MEITLLTLTIIILLAQILEIRIMYVTNSKLEEYRNSIKDMKSEIESNHKENATLWKEVATTIKRLTDII